VPENPKIFADTDMIANPVIDEEDFAADSKAAPSLTKLMVCALQSAQINKPGKLNSGFVHLSVEIFVEN
jgi:hypothetical protein